MGGAPPVGGLRLHRWHGSGQHLGPTCLLGRACRRRRGVDQRAGRTRHQGVPHPLHRPAVVRVTGHRGLEQRREPTGLGQAWRLLVHDAVERTHQVVADLVRRTSGEGVEQGGAQGPDVAGGRGHLTGRHLGREVGRGAGDQAGLGQRGVRLGARDAEVRELHLAALGDEDVRRLHVAVDDARGVRRGQGVGRLPEDGGGQVGRECSVPLHQARQGHALDVLHHQPALVALGDQVEDGHHVRMVEPGRKPCLPLGAHEVRGLAARGRADPLDRDVAAQVLVASEPDRAHAASTDLPVEGVSACDQVLPFPPRGILRWPPNATRNKPGGRPHPGCGRLVSDVPRLRKAHACPSTPPSSTTSSGAA